MTSSPEPPVDRPTKMRWGCVLAASFLGLVLLASVSLPHFGSKMTGRITAAAIHASTIHKALMLYAADHEGRFPEASTSSNQAFRQLFREYLNDEKYFYIPGSAWHSAAPENKPDNIIGFHPPYDKALQPGENHWAYVSGLGDKSHGDIPLIADGFVEESPGTYTDDPSKKGGVWKGSKAIVVFVSGSAKALPLSAKSGFRVLRADPATGIQTDLFRFPAAAPGESGVRVLDPE